MLMTSWLNHWNARRQLRKTRRPRHNGRRVFTSWAAECLEDRTLLSNIAISAAAGVVALAGDSGNHDLTATVTNGNLEFVGSYGTTLTYNHTTSTVVDVPLSQIGQVQALHISMQGSGTNNIDFDAQDLGTINGNVVINLGNGGGSLNFLDADVTGIVAVHSGGTGDAAITLVNDTVGGVSIHTGAGDDTILLADVTLQARQLFSPNSFSDLPFDSWNLGSALVIDTGAGNDTVELDSVIGDSSNWGNQWQITSSGNDAVTFVSDVDNGSLFISGWMSGNDSVSISDSTFGQNVFISLPMGQDQIQINGSTFEGAVFLTTGFGSGSSISIDDSQFESLAAITMFGSNAELDIETAGVSGPGTEFQGPVLIDLLGSSSTVNLGTNSVSNALTFDSFVSILGSCSSTVNIDDANVWFQYEPMVIGANRVDM